EDDFLALPHSSEKLELVDGEVVVTPGPTWHHQTLAAGLYDTLRAWTRTVGPPWVVRFGPLDLRLAPGRIVQPDLLLLREPPPL
ncbi:MAG: Uma2 family endonuclease, partial [Myxococcales bacterium]|nr:Uma2 family endonuclease [Myxococcales bacterium]